MIRIVVIDDQALVRSGLVELLSFVADFAVVGDAGNARDGAALVIALKPDVVLLDVRMPGGSGIDVLKGLQAADCQVPTILLTTFDDREALCDGIRHGARGFLLKDISLEFLAAAIRDVAAGGMLLRPAVTERLSHEMQKLRPTFDRLDWPDRLSPREIEVLRLMAGGLSNREIADSFGTSEGTVKNQVSSILSKLGVRDRVRAVLVGISEGWI
ncbi:MAG: response regulator transcription factor [Azospirillaceae bacterium]|nr:response regulator transcription factor [Azospirillaceae bacterium]